MRVKLTGEGVSFNRGVKLVRVKFFKPQTKPCKLARRKLFDGLLDVFGGSHGRDIALAHKAWKGLSAATASALCGTFLWWITDSLIHHELTSQRVCWSELRVADLLDDWVGIPSSRHGSWIHVPSAVRCCALQGDKADCSVVFGASEFLASTGAVNEAREAIEPTKIACLIRMEGSPFSKWADFEKRLWRLFAATIAGYGNA
jgi:hypothetical protein